MTECLCNDHGYRHTAGVARFTSPVSKWLAMRGLQLCHCNPTNKQDAENSNCGAGRWFAATSPHITCKIGNMLDCSGICERHRTLLPVPCPTRVLSLVVQLKILALCTGVDAVSTGVGGTIRRGQEKEEEKEDVRSERPHAGCHTGGHRRAAKSPPSPNVIATRRTTWQGYTTVGRDTPESALINLSPCGGGGGLT